MIFTIWSGFFEGRNCDQAEAAIACGGIPLLCNPPLCAMRMLPTPLFFAQFAKMHSNTCSVHITLPIHLCLFCTDFKPNNHPNESIDVNNLCLHVFKCLHFVSLFSIFPICILSLFSLNL